MTALSRRRFLTISASAVGLTALPAQASPLYHWRGIALGAGASISLSHPQAETIVARALAEISRLEDIFSLYRSKSALSQLNADGYLTAPPFELLECLGLCDRVHTASGGLFDPTIQPLWALHAENYAAGNAPDAAAIARVRAQTGWDAVYFDAAEVRLQRPGMALTLNSVAQGFVADRVAALLESEGLDDILINTGELRAIGGQPQGGGWPVRISGAGELTLENRALASSSPLGTVFDAAGLAGHILDPRTGMPALPRWGLISVSAPQAGLADALSTACCLMETEEAVIASLNAFSRVRLEHIAPARHEG